MRSNNVAHIGNNTFFAVTRSEADGAFLFSSSFPSAERVAPLPLDRQTRFHPHSTLLTSLEEGDQGATTAKADPCVKEDDTVEAGADRNVPLHPAASPWHSTHASPDGRRIALISNGLRHHYVVDLAVEPAVVCTLEVPHLVRSVCWHAACPHMLFVLFVTGDLTLYNTVYSHLGVVVPRWGRVALRPIIQRCLSDCEVQAHVTAADTPRRTSTPRARSADSTMLATAAAATSAWRPDEHAKRTPGKNNAEGTVATGRVHTCGARDVRAAPLSPSPSLHESAAAAARMPWYSANAASETAASSHRPVYAREGTNMREVSGHDSRSTGSQEQEGVTPLPRVSTSPTPTEVAATSQLDLVDLFVLPFTESTPVILLLLSSSGDVYAVHLGGDMLPVRATAAATDDGRVRTLEEEAQRRAEVEAVPLNWEVHHLIATDEDHEFDEALAVRACLVDADAGTYAVFFCTANGIVKGAWVTEPDLLARHRVAHLQRTGRPNISFTVHLRGHLDVRRCLSPMVPSTTHTLSMVLSENVCLVRCGISGGTSYVLAFPRWDRRRQGWCCWWPTCGDARERAHEREALPLLSTDAAIPLPVALALPYDTCNSGVAVGCTEVLIVPERGGEESGDGGRPMIIVIRLASLLRSALYARCGTLRLHPATESGSTAAVAEDDNASTKATATSDVGCNIEASRVALVELVNAVPECHRLWLRGAPREAVDAATAKLAGHVERFTEDLNRRVAAQAQRRQRLMAKLITLEEWAEEKECTLTTWRQTVLDAVVHRRGDDAIRTGNERLGQVWARLNELEQEVDHSE